ncbi:hypothetical protein EYF80_019574 [Liparis tanakae]|uniref:Uncharacterized protein n=1 Tax=Liparis tanakae TaxID=230148 RepID=A0A4Z2HYZ1_9TELE|nr:hypothetical protein EYF80_019574 [Liparis tanakae]
MTHRERKFSSWAGQRETGLSKSRRLLFTSCARPEVNVPIGSHQVPLLAERYSPRPHPGENTFRSAAQRSSQPQQLPARIPAFPKRSFEPSRQPDAKEKRLQPEKNSPNSNEACSPSRSGDIGWLTLWLLGQQNQATIPLAGPDGTLFLPEDVIQLNRINAGPITTQLSN